MTSNGVWVGLVVGFLLGAAAAVFLDADSRITAFSGLCVGGVLGLMFHPRYGLWVKASLAAALILVLGLAWL
jgi:hypothetical protein